MRALVLLLLLSACDGEVLVDIDAGFPDAGVLDAGFPDAGVVGEPDAGPEVCDVEDVEFPFECEPDADWCSPRDQFHAYYDLAAGWSHQLDEETWVVEVRLYGRLPMFRSSRLWIEMNSGEAPTLGSENGSAPSATCAGTTDRYYASDRDSVSAHFLHWRPLWCARCPPTGAGGVGRECEDDAGCAHLSVNSDLTAFRFEIPLIAPNLFWSARALSQGDACDDYSSPQFVGSQGGSIDDIVWLPAENVLTCPTDH